MLDGSRSFQIGDVFSINIGIGLRHPKDPPNRRVGNAVASGRMKSTDFTVSNVMFTHDNGILFWAYNQDHQLCFQKKFNNKNFYLVGLNCLK